MESLKRYIAIYLDTILLRMRELEYGCWLCISLHAYEVVVGGAGEEERRKGRWKDRVVKEVN